LGILGLHMNVLRGQWKDIANSVGLNIIKMGKEVIHEKMLIEMELSLTDNSNRQKILHAVTAGGTSGY
jgi:hypothetical protein